MRRLSVLVCLLALTACAPAPEAPAPQEPKDTGGVDWAIAIHGGAGVRHSRVPPEAEAAYKEGLRRALELGRNMLEEGASSLDVVESVLATLEDDPLFNAGKGAVFTNEGTHEMDAAIMDGRDQNCGSISGVKTIRNPIHLARKVMDESRHVFLMGSGAETFAAEQGLEIVDPEYFFVQRRYDQWQRVVEKERNADAEKSGKSAGRPEGKLGTVGAVVLDRHGNLAAGNSTGGMTNKRFGRVGDVPVIGAGTYASNRSAAVACTGFGEQFIRNTVARDVAALVEFGGLDLEAAARKLIFERLDEGDGGLVAVDSRGNMTLTFNSEGMFRGAADSSGRFEVGIWADGE